MTAARDDGPRDADDERNDDFADTDSPVGRRTVLGLTASAASVAIAGCSGVPNPLDDDGPQLDGAALGQIATATPPSVPERLPVEVEQSRVDESRARAESLLGSVPTPLDAEELPNEAMRVRLERAERYASEGLRRASAAPTAFEALDNLRDARQDARVLAGAWAYVDDGLTRDDVFDAAASLGNDVDDFRARWEYVGDDPVSAVVVHAALEDFADAATNYAEVDARDRTPPENAITVGEAAGDVERGRVYLEDAAYLYDRFRSTRQDAESLDSVFSTARGALVDELRRRRRRLPAGDDAKSYVDSDDGLEETPAAKALRDLQLDLQHGSSFTKAAESDVRGAASALTGAHEEFARLRAFDSLRERVENGERDTVESVADVKAIRSAAVTAVESSMETSAAPALTRTVASRLANAVDGLDREFERYGDDGEDDDVDARRLDYELSQYVVVREMARAVPDASEHVADALRSA